MYYVLLQVCPDWTWSADYKGWCGNSYWARITLSLVLELVTGIYCTSKHVSVMEIAVWMGYVDEFSVIDK